MIFSKRYGLFARTLLKKPAEKTKKIFLRLGPTLEKAQLGLTPTEYISSFLLTLILVLPLIAILGLLGAYVVVGNTLLRSIVLDIAIVTGSGGVMYLFYFIFPRTRINSLKRKLNQHAPYAATHLATLAGTGVPPSEIFRMLGEFKEYGEVAKTCERIARKIKVFGYDTLTAISKEAQTTPSNIMKDLLWTMVATIRTGGDLREVLTEKAASLLQEQRRKEEKYIETLSMMAEIYSTVFVAGVIMMFVLVSIMGIMGGLPIPVKLLLQTVTYIGIPIAAIAFLTIVESSKPTGL